MKQRKYFDKRFVFLLIALAILFVACDQDELTYVLDNESPIASITSPVDGQSFVERDTVGFSGTGTDPEDEARYFQSVASDIVLNDLELWNIVP